MTLLLFCGTALAKTEVKPGTDSSATVTADESGQKFTVSKTGVTKGDLYLVMIQKGAATDKPTSENLYYLNVEAANDTTFTLNAYPKDLAAGDYVVYLSDYSGSNNGARKAVATITVSDNSEDPTVKYGDVDGNGTINGKDLTALARYLADRKDYMPGGSKAINMENANCDGKGEVNGRDLTSLARHLAERKEYAVLPH